MNRPGHRSPANVTIPAVHWPRLLRGTLIKRYSRFLADVRLRNGHVVTAHCPNSGSMLTCREPGRPVFLSRSTNPARKLKYTWELIDMGSSVVGVNTIVPNRLVKAAAETGYLPELRGYQDVRSEVKYGANSRIDVLLENNPTDRCYVEVKNCTLVEDSVAFFPDAVTERGRKHLVELQAMVVQGQRAIIFFLIQRTDAVLFRPADRIDPAYGEELRRAYNAGVEILVHDVNIDSRAVVLRNEVPFEL